VQLFAPWSLQSVCASRCFAAQSVYQSAQGAATTTEL
jgi:hypothetical protein